MKKLLLLIIPICLAATCETKPKQFVYQVTYFSGQEMVRTCAAGEASMTDKSCFFFLRHGSTRASWVSKPCTVINVPKDDCSPFRREFSMQDIAMMIKQDQHAFGGTK